MVGRGPGVGVGDGVGLGVGVGINFSFCKPYFIVLQNVWMLRRFGVESL
jgi:hypothetical protein